LEKVKKKGGNSSEPAYEYHIGSRSKIEIGRIKILEHTAKVFGDDSIDPIKRKEIEEEIRLEAAREQGEESSDDEQATQATQASQTPASQRGRGRRAQNSDSASQPSQARGGRGRGRSRSVVIDGSDDESQASQSSQSTQRGRRGRAR